MKKNLIQLLVVFLIPFVAQAHELSVGLDIHDFSYEEELDAPLKSTEKASINAAFIAAKVDFSKIYKVYLKGFFETAGAVSSHYDGTTQSGTPVQDTNSHSFTRAEAAFYFETAPNLFLYAGLGYRYWNRFLVGGSGYREIYTWTYLPMGAYWEIQSGDRFHWGLDLSYRQMVSGEIKVIFSETIANGDDTTMTLGNKPGYKFQAPVWIGFTPVVGMTVTPWYEFSQIGESDFKYNSTPGVASYIQEPSSKTTQYGVALGIGYQF